MGKRFLILGLMSLALNGFAQSDTIQRTKDNFPHEVLGVRWSDVLKNQKGKILLFANCISVKNSDGTPKVVNLGEEYTYVECQGHQNKNGNFIYEGISADGKKVEKSDATEACKKQGGSLPEVEDLKKLENHWNDGSVSEDFKEEMWGHVFWSSSVVSDFQRNAYDFIGNNRGLVYSVDRKFLVSVRCVDR